MNTTDLQGMSQSCVVEAMYRHFYPWRPTRENPTPRIVYSNDDPRYQVTIIHTEKDKAPQLERALIITLNPRDNRERYESYFSEGLMPVMSSATENAGASDDLPF